ncbi:MAG: LOG family protein [Bacilli bacterium]|nr:LOG family protein [Bacilli bacterium]
MQYKELASIVATKLSSLGFTLVSKTFDSGMIFKSIMTFKYEDKPIIGVSDVNDANGIDESEYVDSIVTKNTFERTKEIFKLSDLIIVLPGGLGTLSELFSFIDEMRTKKIYKRVILFNYNNYYSDILKFIIKAHDEGFMSEDDIKLISIVNDINTLNDFLERMER